MPARTLSTNERAFEFGAGDDYDGATQRAAGVDIFSERHIFDIRSAQLIQNFKEVFDRPWVTWQNVFAAKLLVSYLLDGI